jgi:hypothetical protein
LFSSADVGRGERPRSLTTDTNSDVVFYSNLLEQAEEATLAAKADWENAKAKVQRDAFLHDQEVKLENGNATSDEAFRTSQWTLSRSNADLDRSVEVYNEALINQALYKLHLESAEGQTENPLLLSQLNEQLWQRRVDIAQTNLRLAEIDRDYYDYHFHMILKLVGQHAEDQTTLAKEAFTYQKAMNQAALAKDTLQHVELAHQHAVDLSNQVASQTAKSTKKG